ncbi:MAG: hypothetical protein IJT32_02340 [Lachnospiraceae bacterium]|nr:hypothetical protein [Lachnospiraceae bacterium]
MGIRRLSDELEKYGYVFSLRRSALLYGTMFLCIFALGRFFALHLTALLVLFAYSLILLPFFIRSILKNRYHQKRFSDLNIYMEQFLYSFQKSGKILTTLEDMLLIFENGHMRKTIEQARDHILFTFNESRVEKNALAIIEEAYPYDGLKTMHRFAYSTEVLGGDYEDSILLLLEARRMWADRVYVLQQEQKVKRREVFLSIAVSLLLCSMIFLISSRLEVDVAAHPIVQVITTLVLMSDMWIFYIADKRLTVGFVESDHTNDAEMVERYRRMKRYSDKNPIERLARRAAKKTLSRELEKQFPNWLMEVSLLLQTENVSVAITRSYELAPELLKPPLQEFLLEIAEKPDEMAPYLHFLDEFALPEVRSSMKMLYSLSSGTGGNARGQIADIIRRSQQLLDKSEKLKNEDSLAGMYALFLAPQLTGGCKLLVDMVLLLVLYLKESLW